MATIRPRHRRVAASVALTACLLAGGAAAASVPASAAASADSAAASVARPSVQVFGSVDSRLRLTSAELAALPQQTVTVTFQAAGVPQTHTYTGPLLYDVIEAAKPSFDSAVKNDALRYTVRAQGSDGYRAVVAWGEIDPGFEGKAVLVATTEDGAPMPDGRPRLVVPGDRKGGRYVSGLTRLHLGV